MKTDKIYKHEDLPQINRAQEQAVRDMNAYIDLKGLRDGGTCVMGECIYINYIPPKCRKPIRLPLVRQPFQGNNYEPLSYAKRILEVQGIVCHYDHGRMD